MTEDEFIYFLSNNFIEAVYNEISQGLQHLISNIIKYVKTQNDKVNYYKKWIIFHMSISKSSYLYYTNLNSSVYPLFYHFFQKEMKSHHFVNPDPSMWCYFPLDLDEQTFKGSNLKLDRKAILSNMSQAPMLIKQQTVVTFNGNSGSIYDLDFKNPELGHIPEHILHLGMISSQMNSQKKT